MNGNCLGRYNQLMRSRYTNCPCYRTNEKKSLYYRSTYGFGTSHGFELTLEKRLPIVHDGGAVDRKNYVVRQRGKR